MFAQPWGIGAEDGLLERIQELKKEVQEANRALNRKKNRGGGSAPTGDYAMGVTDAPKAVNSRVRIRGETRRGSGFEEAAERALGAAVQAIVDLGVLDTAQ